jgi:hypothetical protein
MKKSFFLIIILLTLVSCSGLKNAQKILRNEKVNSTDEFLVEKKRPLILPPDYNKIPEPGSKSESNDDENRNIKKILKAPKEETKVKKNATSTESSILNRIRK